MSKSHVLPHVLLLPFHHHLTVNNNPLPDMAHGTSQGGHGHGGVTISSTQSSNNTQSERQHPPSLDNSSSEDEFTIEQQRLCDDEHQAIEEVENREEEAEQDEQDDKEDELDDDGSTDTPVAVPSKK
ncbi:hypothetical protein ARMSODRAFT_1020147 [Armillaria solidipes]|uniref:Uncharacterized protein n=1 Tax=Armillaria solidipes TaxID=1076256 RepID=A0A2H3BYM0_9AGAR|nr:hypothetical protein ARMSODRAFT_1020147 [Armillaria solidipes]